MKVYLHLPHKIRNRSIRDLVDLYCKYSSRYLRVDIQTRPIRAGRDQARPELLDAIRSGRGVLLSEHGKAVNTQWFSRTLTEAMDSATTLHFVVGDAHGYPPELEHVCRDQIALTPLTLPHEMAAMILTEQIWRAISILRNHPYHK